MPTTTIIYLTKQGDRLDQICYDHYNKQSGVMEWVMANNPHLRTLPILLPVGTEIDMVPMPKQATRAEFLHPWSL